MKDEHKMDENDQISIDFQYPYQYHRETFFNYNMLIDDLCFSKYGYNRDEISFNLESDNPSTDLEDIFAKFEFPRDSWGRINANSEILEFFVSISNALICDGICCFERISSLKDNKVERIRMIKGDLRKKKKCIVQHLPKELGNKRVKIPLNKCYVLEFPNEICSTNEYLKTMEKIKKIDSKDPVLSILNPSHLSKVKGYDPFEHKNYLELILWKLSKKISWHHRSYASHKEFFSNYYTSLRDLNFKKNKLILMNHVFRFMEKMIDEEMKGVKSSITFTKSLDDIELLIMNFKTGNIKSDDYLQAIRDYR